MASDHDGIDGQRRHWRSTFEGNPTMYGTQPSEPGRYAVELFRAEGVRDVAELGAGQGRDTLAFLQAGMTVTALDYADEGLAELREAAVAAGAGDRLTTIVSDAREPLPLVFRTSASRTPRDPRCATPQAAERHSPEPRQPLQDWRSARCCRRRCPR